MRTTVFLLLLTACTSGKDDSDDKRGCEQQKVLYDHGDSWQCPDGCNTCSCHDGSIAMTEIACLTDTGPTDTGATDTSATDTGPTDTGATDTSATDTDPTDTDPTDTDPTDTDPTDTDTDPTDTDTDSTVTRSTLWPAWCPSTNTAPGLYQGNLSSNTNDISNVGCVGGAMGRDGSVRLVLQPGETVTATYQSTTGDAVLYILDSCPVTSSCLVGADSFVSSAETVTWKNNDSVANPIYVVLDNDTLAGSGPFTLDLSVQ